MEPVLSRDPRTGEVLAEVGVEADTAAIDVAVRAAYATLDLLADRAKRSALLRAAADGVEARAAELIAVADAETALGVPRLTGELARVAYQFRFFADIVDEGAFLGVVVDEPDPAAVPPRPALRRWKVPIGAVAVFAASNFPFAFSVPGGDTASALAAGCPVVVKAHPDHPQTSELAAATIRAAAEQVGLPANVLVLVHGYQAGVDLGQLGLARHQAVDEFLFGQHVDVGAFVQRLALLVLQVDVAAARQVVEVVAPQQHGLGLGIGLGHGHHQLFARAVGELVGGLRSGSRLGRGGTVRLRSDWAQGQCSARQQCIQAGIESHG